LETVVLTSDDISYAVDVILRGGLVAVPTETVYGLAGNGLDANAVSSIYSVKGRPEIKPISLLVSNLNAARDFCKEINESAIKLADAFWPGPLTMILRSSYAVPEIVTAGGDTVGIRCPDHPKTLELLKLSGVPLAAPSANPSDMPSPKSAKEVLDYFDGLIDCVIDGGICSLGVESTIVDLTVKPPVILRHGALSETAILRIMYDE